MDKKGYWFSGKVDPEDGEALDEFITRITAFRDRLRDEDYISATIIKSTNHGEYLSFDVEAYKNEK